MRNWRRHPRTGLASARWNWPGSDLSCCWRVTPPPIATGRSTIQVASLAPVLAALESAGGEVLEGPAPAPNGAKLIARHPDGAVFEYIETGDAG